MRITRNIRLSLLAITLLFLLDLPVQSMQPLDLPGTLAPPAARQILPFDADWRFNLSETPGAEKADFNDTQWRTLDLPHDWSIEGTPDLRNPSGAAGAFLPTGIAWYRKTFTTPATAADKQIFIEFDGIMMNASVYLNGQLLGTRPSGYQTVRYPLANLHPDATPNTLAVRADNSLQPASRWYAGSGINRHVRLIITGNIHFEEHATFIFTTKSSAESAMLHVETSVMNRNADPIQVHIEVDVIGPDGKPVRTVVPPAKIIPGGKAESLAGDFPVAIPKLWSVEAPNMYRAVVRIRPGDAAGGKAPTLDDQTIPFGIRTAEFKPDTGFWLNGKNIKLYGVCLHADGGGIGTAVPLGIWQRRLKALREVGINAIRTSHNAPDPAFLDLCDKMGFVVMHEVFDCWTVAKTRGDYARFFNDWYERDLTDAVMRDRNHPCIILYSAGNEIHDSQEKQLEILPKLIALYHKLDPTRPVTQALFRPENAGAAYSNGIAAMLDVVGTNYRPNLLVEQFHQHPEYKTIGTEDNYRALELQVLRDSPSLSGEFLWTGIDYLGEGFGQSIAQGFGLFDRTIAPRFRAFEYQAWYVPADVNPTCKIGRLETLPGGRGAGERGGGRVMDWTPADLTPGANQTVEVQSNCEQVELFLNGKSLGKQTRPATWAARTWRVPFEPGTLKAIATHNDKQAATDELKTAGPATHIKLTIDQTKLTPTFDDVAILRTELVDDHGILNPNATAKITFKLEGPGTIAAIDNADLDSHEPFRGNTRSTYRATNIAILKATANTGTIKITATAEGFTEGTVTIQSFSVAK